MNRASKLELSSLHRLTVACRDEALALDAAAQIHGAGARQAQLTQQSWRRLTFRRDLDARVIALGGVPVQSPSYGARVSGALQSLRRLVTGPHVGDAYAACARATGKTGSAYSDTLRSKLPVDDRLGLERQYVEIELDWKELRRLRWGTSPMPLPDQALQTEGGAASSAR